MVSCPAHALSSAASVHRAAVIRLAGVVFISASWNADVVSAEANIAGTSLTDLNGTKLLSVFRTE